MAVIPVTYVRCPKCRAEIDFFVSGFCTHLGPPRAQCRKCGKRMASGRREWSEFTGFDKFRYAFLTLLFAGIVGYLGGVSVRGAENFWQNGPHSTKFTLSSPSLTIGAIAWALSVIALQVYRVVRSSRRTESGASKKAVRVGLANPDFNLQFTLLAAVWLPALIGWIASWIMNRGG
jgi:hypothetical protein